MFLPRFMVLQSKVSGKYLRYVNEDEGAKGCMQFTGVSVANPYSKFAVEMAEVPDCREKGLVHIRCCYNNKYWASQSNCSGLIVATAKKKEEDGSGRSCTLFQPIQEDGGGVRFLHVHLQCYASPLSAESSSPTDHCLHTGSDSAAHDSGDVYKVTDWESLAILPQRVTFKADNGCYISCDSIGDLRFRVTDLGHPLVGYVTTTHPDGTILIKSDATQKFWTRRSNGDIYGVSSNGAGFWPVKVDHNVVALRVDKRFCMRTGSVNSGIVATLDTVCEEARFEVVEHVLSRSIYFLDFRFDDSRIYNECPILLASKRTSNDTFAPQSVTLTFSYTSSKSSTWTNSISFSSGPRVEFDCGIPFIDDKGKISVSADFTKVYQWGETRTTETALSTTHTVTVPAWSTMTVHLMATKGTCEVPFSYTQQDTLFDGSRPPLDRKDDGCYTGVNCYGFYLKAEPKRDDCPPSITDYDCEYSITGNPGFYLKAVTDDELPAM